MSDKVGVALTKELCLACTKEMDGAIVINTKLTKKNAKEVESLHGQVVGFAEELCDTRKEYTKQGIIIVGIDEEKTTDINNPYRTGHFFVVKESWLDNVEDEKLKKQIAKKRFTFMSHLLLEQNE